MAKPSEAWNLTESLLPPRRVVAVDSEPFFYGGLHTAARHCGLTSPRAISAKSWKHGIIEDQEIRYLRELVHYGGKEDLHLVARDAHVEALVRFGFYNVKAVGMPFAYARPSKAPRIPSSLLVMPVHSTHHSTFLTNEDAYIEALLPTMRRFDLVVFCLHASCVQKNLWTETLKRRGVRYVAGASIDDANSLVRMRMIFDSFECVSANSLVSGLAYASSAGCRVSLHEPFHSPSASEWSEEPFFKAYPELLDSCASFYSEAATRLRLPWLFVPPEQSEVRPEWGNYLVGTAHKKSPTELRKILGWTPLGQAKLAIARLRKWIYKRR